MFSIQIKFHVVFFLTQLKGDQIVISDQIKLLQKPKNYIDLSYNNSMFFK